MKVSKLGQFGMIDLVARMIEESRDNQADSWKNLIDGIGDDCAVWRPEDGSVLAKVDCQVQNVHFNLDIIGWRDLGWKALAVNLSDIAAMGGSPRYALVSLGLPRETEVEDVVLLYQGLLELAEKSGTAIVGGNMSGAEIVFVDVNVIGVTGNKEREYMKRSAAKAGDKVAVSGWLGSSAAGLEMLTKGLKFEESISSYLKEAFGRPEPRLKEGRLLVDVGVKCGIDISDGLLADLGHVCHSSRVGAVIEIERLPVRAEVKAAFGASYLDMALGGGEDYQLLFSAPAAVIEKAQKASTYPLTVIGVMVAENVGEIRVVDQKGRLYQAGKTGWDHFRSR